LAMEPLLLKKLLLTKLCKYIISFILCQQFFLNYFCMLFLLLHISYMLNNYIYCIFPLRFEECKIMLKLCKLYNIDIY